MVRTVTTIIPSIAPETSDPSLDCLTRRGFLVIPKTC